MAAPTNSRNVNGVRVYDWQNDAGETVTLLSVTSIRRLTGIPMGLHNWALSNLANLATGMRQQVRIGPRGGVKKVMCVVPGTRVLTRDLRWVPIETLELGQELWAFTEGRVADGWGGRRWQPSVVTSTGITEAPVVRIHLSSGRVLTCTPDHRWLAITRERAPRERTALGRWVPRGGRTTRSTRWVEAQYLQPGDRLPRYLDPWEKAEGYDAGWLSGIMDGEGSLSSVDQLVFVQKEGLVAEQARRVMREAGLNWHEHPRLRANPKHATCIEFRFFGDVSAIASVLGTYRPVRLVPKWAPVTLQTARSRSDFVVSVEDAGIQPVVNLSTSTETFFAEGYGSHNTKDGDFPGEFVTRMIETRGNEEKLEAVRRWLRESADEPRDIAAVRGTVVHRLIELDVTEPDEKRIRDEMTKQWADERRRVKPEVTADDVTFVANAMRQYRDMREHTDYVILAREVQVWNLEVGYAGSADVMLWFLPPGEVASAWQVAADKGKVTIENIATIGGKVVLGDYKTSEGLYVDHAVQATAYMAATFVGDSGVVDERLTALLRAMMEAALIQIRPDGWHIAFVPFREDILQAFLGSTLFARFVALNEDLSAIVTEQLEGKAPTEEVAA